MTSIRLSLLSSALLTLTACGGGGGGGDSGPNPTPDLRTRATIGPPGGTLAVTQGDLNGTALNVPATALANAVEISVQPGTATPFDGLVAVSEVAEFGPQPLGFTTPATIALGYDPQALPSPRTDLEFVVVARDEPTGEQRILRSLTVDRDAQTVMFDVSSLASFWIAVPADASQLTDNALPWLDGIDFDFLVGNSSNVVNLKIERRADVPNIDGVVSVVTFTSGTQTDGGYLRRMDDGSLHWLGNFDQTGDTQDVVTGQVTWLPTVLSAGAGADTEYDVTRYTPIGSNQPDSSALGRLTVRVVAVGATLETPISSFENTVQVLWTTTAPNGDTTEFRMWFAPGVGPIQFKDGDAPLTRLAAGTINGAPIVVD